MTTIKTAFQAIEEALKPDPKITFKDIRTKAKASNGAVLAYLKLKKTA